MINDQKQLHRFIDEILWIDWDPIGVNDLEEARNEYHSYVPVVFDLKISGADELTIAAYLHQIETVNMGLHGNLQNCLLVAKKITAAKF
jgi:hypothetical protein